jgi:hypothetical protein
MVEGAERRGRRPSGRCSAGCGLAAVLLALALSRTAGAAEPQDLEQARLLYQKATAAYGLGNFAEAALEYEQAFALTTKPELLFNAAQAHRRAGNKERALALYSSYLQIFPKGSGRELAERRIDELTRAIQTERSTTPPPARTVLPMAPPPQPPPAMVLTTAPAADSTRPLYRSPWFWVGVGAVAVVSVLTVVALSGTKQPSPTWGTVGGR